MRKLVSSPVPVLPSLVVFLLFSCRSASAFGGGALRYRYDQVDVGETHEKSCFIVQNTYWNPAYKELRQQGRKSAVSFGRQSVVQSVMQRRARRHYPQTKRLIGVATGNLPVVGVIRVNTCVSFRAYHGRVLLYRRGTSTYLLRPHSLFCVGSRRETLQT